MVEQVAKRLWQHRFKDMRGWRDDEPNWAISQAKTVTASVLAFLAAHPSERERLFGDREKALAEYLADPRSKPEQCPVCMNWCLYDGWDWTHGYGLGVGACAARPSMEQRTSVATPDGSAVQDDETPKERP